MDEAESQQTKCPGRAGSVFSHKLFLAPNYEVKKDKYEDYLCKYHAGSFLYMNK